MNTLIHADIFFFVTTIAVVLIAALFIVVIIYVVRILTDLRYVSGMVRRQTDLLAGDMDDIREEIRAEVRQKGVFGGMYALILSMFGKGKRSGERKTKKTKKH
ncbi:MAG: hypothetical protein A2855_02660 [Candidatus Liptonbacteria bacterium RIFCSPHIGHO2_01_FULL_57_28]|uniref:Uncharacterized protein n=1 Tax=Candidatus Liptonbacteria bacterium RIFCSPHIGHO2_01_FULL_57_28 TaxID=1798647 RepID=A0A1G2CB19_9BACT|nr:MAG: hypothetical protein A2855_02660 [Candidatus Liptonbacteria bacterium RIFCSPHIGHO2_01_FULL_57_28]